MFPIVSFFELSPIIIWPDSSLDRLTTHNVRLAELYQWLNPHFNVSQDLVAPSLTSMNFDPAYSLESELSLNESNTAIEYTSVIAPSFELLYQVINDLGLALKPIIENNDENDFGYSTIQQVEEKTSEVVKKTLNLFIDLFGSLCGRSELKKYLIVLFALS